MKINEFAAFCNVTNRALQLYDKMGLFSPARVDENTGYRYYDVEQIAELNTINSFKQVGFTLKEIKLIKEQHYSREEVVRMLHKKQIENSDKIEVLSYNNEIISGMLTSLGVCLDTLSEEEEALKISKLVRLDNEKLQEDFSKILWL